VSQATTAPFGFLRVGAACPPVSVANPDRNVAQMLRTFADAQAQGVQVLLFPELGITGYTAGDLFFSVSSLIKGAEAALGTLARETRRSATVIVVGLPALQDGRLFNTAAVLQAGEVLGLVPKSYLPGYREYYEERWFSSAREASSDTIRLLGRDVPFGPDLLFTVPDEPGACLAVEICEDLWAPLPPSARHSVAGAVVLLNPSASNDLVGKAQYRRELVKHQSARTLSAYIYANTGVHESTTDAAFAGQLLIAEFGAVLAESERFKREGELLVADVDTERLIVERARQTSFADAVHDLRPRYRRLALRPIPSVLPDRLRRCVDPHPFVPQDPSTLHEHCREIFSVQTAGLAKRLEHTGARRALVGLSGGLDSTLALLVAARAFDLLKLPRTGVLAVTMPGFGTSERTLTSARGLAAATGVSLREIDIRAACEQHIRDIGLPPDDRASVTFQNLQARERTQVLMDLANKEGGLVIGTGDLSELALGYCTFAGDHIAMYNVNATLPKTLVRRIVRFLAENHATPAEREVLHAVLETPVMAELVAPTSDGGVGPATEELIGPYELHDFFLWCFVRLGASPRKMLFLAENAFHGRYERETLLRWLRLFVERFFDQQWKRSVLPDGPKVGSVSLSPRADWRMPSDASKEAWLRELD
jgi:NAD+ synthase (glutamine-hydrolysing)